MLSHFGLGAFSLTEDLEERHTIKLPPSDWRAKMTNAEKEQIASLRHAGCSYKEIAMRLAMNESTVKSHCFRNHLSDKDIPLSPELSKGVCPQCGARIEQREKRKPRRFCSDTCRTKWWNNNRHLKHHRNLRTVKCPYCGREFALYGNATKRYCSQSCYLKARYGGDRT